MEIMILLVVVSIFTLTNIIAFGKVKHLEKENMTLIQMQDGMVTHIDILYGRVKFWQKRSAKHASTIKALEADVKSLEAKVANYEEVVTFANDHFVKHSEVRNAREARLRQTLRKTQEELSLLRDSLPDWAGGSLAPSDDHRAE